jgi:hypothetical protein
VLVVLPWLQAWCVSGPATGIGVLSLRLWVVRRGLPAGGPMGGATDPQRSRAAHRRCVAPAASVKRVLRATRGSVGFDSVPRAAYKTAQRPKLSCEPDNPLRTSARKWHASMPCGRRQRRDQASQLQRLVEPSVELPSRVRTHGLAGSARVFGALARTAACVPRGAMS